MIAPPSLSGPVLHHVVDVDHLLGAHRRRVLVVEDSEEIRDLWRIWLTSEGFDVDEASNGADGVAHAFARVPDVVLMDLWLPIVDGLEATRQLKADPRTTAVPVIAITAEGSVRIRQRAMESGCDHFIRKPITPEDLRDQLHRVILTARPSPTT